MSCTNHQTIKAYLSHRNPDNIDALFQRPKCPSAKFNPNEATVWYEKSVLGHNLLDNMLRNMSERAGISPYYTNHSLRATTVTVLSCNNVETRKIKAVTGHRSDTSIQGYCERPTLIQFKHISSTLSSFFLWKSKHRTCLSSSSSTSTVGPCQLLAETVEDSKQFFAFGRNQPSILQAHGVQCPASILPSGTFQGCSSTFNINMNNN